MLGKVLNIDCLSTLNNYFQTMKFKMFPGENHIIIFHENSGIVYFLMILKTRLEF